MHVLIIGSGGREHALAWKISQSPRVTKLSCAPGNAGIAEIADLVPVKANDIEALLRFALEHGVDLTVVGPEQALTEGIVDRFEAKGLKIFGPSKLAAQLEGSKAFAKQFMQKHGIPTAEFRSFELSQRYDAERYINEIPVPIVLKADGLAAGKGVTVCETKEDALDILDLMMGRKAFGDAGLKVVIEEFLDGEEASVFAITDGNDCVLLSSAQDHKRIFDNDLGKNTGGMGAYSPAPVMSPELMKQVERTIVRPTIQGMKSDGHPYKGCLYVGLMITETGPKVIEYNCRFGDPETEVILPLLKSDLVDLMLASVGGTLGSLAAEQHPLSAVCVVIASGGYPDQYESGMQIVGLDAARMLDERVMVFHAGTAREKNTLVTAGGRVLGVTAVGPAADLEQTIDRAYRAVEKITFDGAYYRSDIGKKGVERLRQLRKEGNA